MNAACCAKLQDMVQWKKTGEVVDNFIAKNFILAVQCTYQQIDNIRFADDDYVYPNPCCC